MTIAPWLQPLNFIEAARAGAEVGLQQRKIANDALAEAMRNSVARDEIAAKSGNAAKELESNDNFRKSELENQSRRLDQGDSRLSDLESNRDAVNALRSRGLDISEAKADKAKDLPVKITIGNDEMGKPITQSIPTSKLKDTLRSLPAGWSQDPRNKVALSMIPKDQWYDGSQPAASATAALQPGTVATPQGTSSYGPVKDAGGSVGGHPIDMDAVPNGTSNATHALNPKPWNFGVKAIEPNDIPTIDTTEDYAKLPSGSQYYDSNGNLGRKK